jgi:hypothetical protein
MEKYSDFVKSLRDLPRYSTITCECGNTQKVDSLQIYFYCKECDRNIKIRGFASIGSEIQDYITAVLDWCDENPIDGAEDDESEE